MWRFLQIPFDIFSVVVINCAVRGYSLLTAKVSDLVEIHNRMEQGIISSNGNQNKRPIKRRRIQRPITEVKPSRSKYHSQDQVIFGSHLQKALAYQRQTSVVQLDDIHSSLPLYKSAPELRSSRKNGDLSLKTRKRKSDVYSVYDKMISGTHTILGSLTSPENDHSPQLRHRTKRKSLDDTEKLPLLPNCKEKVKLLLKEREECIEDDLKKLKDNWKGKGKNQNNQERTLKDITNIEYSEFKSFTNTEEINNNNTNNNDNTINENDADDKKKIRFEETALQIDPNGEVVDFKKAKTELQSDIIKFPFEKTKTHAETDITVYLCDKLNAENEFTKETDSGALDTLKVETTSIEKPEIKTSPYSIVQSKPIILPTRDSNVDYSGTFPWKIGVVKPMNKVVKDDVVNIHTVSDGHILHILSDDQILQASSDVQSAYTISDELMFQRAQLTYGSTELDQRDTDDSDDDDVIPSCPLNCCSIL